MLQVPYFPTECFELDQRPDRLLGAIILVLRITAINGGIISTAVYQRSENDPIFIFKDIVQRMIRGRT